MSKRLDLPEDLFEDIRLRAEREGRGLAETAVELLRTGLAASAVSRGMVIPANDSMLEERKQMAEKFLSGEWGADLSGFEGGRRADRHAAETRERAGRP